MAGAAATAAFGLDAAAEGKGAGAAAAGGKGAAYDRASKRVNDMVGKKQNLRVELRVRELRSLVKDQEQMLKQKEAEIAKLQQLLGSSS